MALRGAMSFRAKRFGKTAPAAPRESATLWSGASARTPATTIRRSVRGARVRERQALVLRVRRGRGDRRLERIERRASACGDRALERACPLANVWLGSEDH